MKSVFPLAMRNLPNPSKASDPTNLRFTSRQYSYVNSKNGDKIDIGRLRDRNQHCNLQ